MNLCSKGIGVGMRIDPSKLDIHISNLIGLDNIYPMYFRYGYDFFFKTSNYILDRYEY